MSDLKDKIALVTGATRGLGYAIAIALAARGAHVIALARTAGALEELDDEITRTGGSATLAPMDLKDDPALERLGAAIHQRWGRLDLMVHCAVEAAPMAPVEHISAADLDKVIAVNIRIPQRLIRVADPLLKAGSGAQAVFVDHEEVQGAKFNGAYGASKAAARALVASWAAESAKRGARIWFAAPPAMPTALRARSHPGEDRSALSKPASVAEALVAHIIAGDMDAGATLDLTKSSN
ncbi:MAG: SDR family NAD(P)-dependent oxidoreductase [Pseudomonadota bacterium]